MSLEKARRIPVFLTDTQLAKMCSASNVTIRVGFQVMIWYIWN